jgi:hypothetical protein
MTKNYFKFSNKLKYKSNLNTIVEIANLLQKPLFRCLPIDLLEFLVETNGISNFNVPLKIKNFEKSIDNIAPLFKYSYLKKILDSKNNVKIILELEFDTTLENNINYLLNEQNILNSRNFINLGINGSSIIIQSVDPGDFGNIYYFDTELLQDYNGRNWERFKISNSFSDYLEMINIQLEEDMHLKNSNQTFIKNEK